MLRSRLLLENPLPQPPDNYVEFSGHPSCVVAIDKESMISKTMFLNIVTNEVCFEFKNPLDVNSKTGGIEFKANNAAQMLLNESYENYTILVHAYLDPDKIENDVVGSAGLGNTDFLLMVYFNKVRAHQWPLIGGGIVLDSVEEAGEFFGQSVIGSPETELKLINNKKVELKASSMYGCSAKPVLTIGARYLDYGIGFFSGEIYSVRFYNKALSETEMLEEFDNMEKRRGN